VISNLIFLCVAYHKVELLVIILYGSRPGKAGKNKFILYFLYYPAFSLIWSIEKVRISRPFIFTKN